MHSRNLEMRRSLLIYKEYTQWPLSFRNKANLIVQPKKGVFMMDHYTSAH